MHSRSREFSRPSSPNSEDSKHKIEKTTSSSNHFISNDVRPSSRSTSENPDLHGRMKSSDRTSTSDGSRSGNDNPMLRFMEMTMKEKLDTATKLEQANQKIQELIEERDELKNTIKDLTSKLQQTIQENNKLKKDLEQQNHLDKKSSLQKGDSSSKSPEEIEAARKAIREWIEKNIK